MHGRDQAAVTSVVTALRNDGGQATGMTGDVTRFSDIEAMRRQIEDDLGPVGMLQDVASSAAFLASSDAA